MKRSTFLFITAILGVVVGLMLLIFPSKMAEGFGILMASPQLEGILRILGVQTLCIGILNFLVRKHNFSSTLQAVLIINIIGHGLNIINDLLSLQYGGKISDMLVFMVGHLFVVAGSGYFLRKTALSDL